MNVFNLTLIGSDGVIFDSSPLGIPMATSRVSCRRGETLFTFYNVTKLFIARLTHRKKKVCRYDTRSVSKVMSPVLTHLHACQIVRCVKSTHVLTGQCAKLLVCYLVSVLNNKCAILPMCQTWCAKLVVCQICLQLVTQ